MSTPEQNVISESTETALAEKVDQAPSIQTVQTPAGVSPIVAMVASGQHSPEVLQQMLDVQKDYEKNEARKAFAEALSEFRKLAPTISKDRHVYFKTSKGQTDYRHASLGNTMDTVNPILGQCGLNISWDTNQQEGLITVTASLSHRMGHRESVSLFAAPDNTGNKNGIQQIKSTITYLQRATAFAILGLAESFDDDGVSYGERVEEVSPKPARPEPSNELMQSFNKHIDDGDGYALISLSKLVGQDMWIALFNSGEKGDKVKTKETVRKLMADAYTTIEATHTQLGIFMNQAKTDAAAELLDETPWKFIEPLASDALKTWVSDELGVEL